MSSQGQEYIGQDVGDPVLTENDCAVETVSDEDLRSQTQCLAR